MAGKNRLAVMLILSIILIVSIVPAALAQEVQASEDVLQQVRNHLENSYVEEVGDDVLQQDSIEAILEELDDPYTIYMTGEDYQSFTKNLEGGEYAGIGAVLEEREGRVGVISVFPNTPAEEAGLEPGDLILQVEDFDTEGATVSEVSELVKGEAGTDVTLEIERSGEEKSITVTREEIEIPAVDYRMVDNDILYLRIYSFNNEVPSEMDEILAEHGDLSGVILDLRDNGGGYLEAAAEVSEFCLDASLPLVYLGRRGELSGVIRMEEAGIETPMVTLINGGSASASEIVAGALKDYNRSILIGENSFGKGSVQSMVGLDNGDYFKFTTNYFKTPDKKPIHKEGIEPDIAYKGEDIIDYSVSILDNDESIPGNTLRLYVKENLLAGGGSEEEVAAEIKDGKTYVPIRTFMSIIGQRIEWASNGRVRVGQDIIFDTAQGEYYKNEADGSEFSHYMEHGKLVVDLQSLLESLEMSFSWDAPTKSIIIIPETADEG